MFVDEPTDWRRLDFEALGRLRAIFLDDGAPRGDYWRSEGDLRAYDQTFGRRIGWKWDYVLDELRLRGWSPPPGGLLDFGCGSGVASRRLVAHFGAAAGEVGLYDRSPLARRYAAGRLSAATGGVPRARELAEPTPAPTLVLSHLLTELGDSGLESLLPLARQATSIIWVEPGTHAASRRLCEIRRLLLGDFGVVAPCTHQAACGMLAAGNERHWCHHFASPPTEVFTDGGWVRFGRIAGIDLRALPLSFLVLDRRSDVVAAATPAAPPESQPVRIIGRARMYKAYAMLLGCDHSGIAERRLMKRHCPEMFRLLKREDVQPLQLWRLDGCDVLEARGLFCGGEGPADHEDGAAAGDPTMT